MRVLVVTDRATTVLVETIVVPTALPGAVLVGPKGDVRKGAATKVVVLTRAVLAVTVVDRMVLLPAALVVDRADQVVLIGPVATVLDVALVASSSGLIKLTASSMKSSARLASSRMIGEARAAFQVDRRGAASAAADEEWECRVCVECLGCRGCRGCQGCQEWAAGDRVLDLDLDLVDLPVDAMGMTLAVDRQTEGAAKAGRKVDLAADLKVARRAVPTMARAMTAVGVPKRDHPVAATVDRIVGPTATVRVTVAATAAAATTTMTTTTIRSS